MRSVTFRAALYLIAESECTRRTINQITGIPSARKMAGKTI
jgi:hypothetical protein